MVSVRWRWGDERTPASHHYRVPRSG